MELRRKLKYHLIQTYMVSTVFLTISWLALFLPPSSIAERLAIAMTILLTLTSMFSSERRSESIIFSCEGGALEVLIYVCASVYVVCMQVEIV